MILRCIKGEENYPEKLNRFDDAPKALSYIGDITLLNSPVSAVIGRRDATEKDILNAKRLGKFLSENSHVVLNGMALGCDAAAIEGALSVNGKVVAILPSGINKIYPKSLKPLADRIIRSGGCVISQFKDDDDVTKISFLERDKLQCMLSDEVIVVAANETGGTRYTANYASKIKKSVYWVSNSDKQDVNILSSPSNLKDKWGHVGEQISI